MKYFAIEGIDGVGKSTQYYLLLQNLKNASEYANKKYIDSKNENILQNDNALQNTKMQDYKDLKISQDKITHTIIFIKEPSNDDFGKHIRELALYNNLNNKTRNFLFLANRSHIFSNLPKCNIIISDRSMISGIAYNDDVSIKKNLALNLMATNNVLPKKIVILKIDKKTLKNRLSAKKLDNIESKGTNALLKIQKKLIKIAKILHKKYHIKYKVIDSTQSKEEIFSQIKNFFNV